jgi:hypothetical protein
MLVAIQCFAERDNRQSLGIVLLRDDRLFIFTSVSPFWLTEVTTFHAFGSLHFDYKLSKMKRIDSSNTGMSR